MLKRYLAPLLALALALSPAIARAAGEWPTRPIRLVVTSAAGSGSDILARVLADRLGAKLGQQVFIDNRPGANGIVATRFVMNAPADGQTLLYSNASATVMLAALQPDLGIDFTRDITPVAIAAIGGVVLMVNSKLPVHNLSELITLVKANPDAYLYASWGIGSNGHLTTEWLKARTGMQISHAPYRSIPTLLTDLVGNQVKIGWSDPVSPLPFLQNGDLRAIAVNGTVRMPQLPDVPTMGEQGFAFPALGWQGIFAPRGLPPGIAEKLHARINEAQRDPELAALMNKLNVEPPPVWTTEKFRSLLIDDLAVWKKIVEDAKITLAP